MAIKCLVQEQLQAQYKTIADPSLVSFLLKENHRLNIYIALIDQTSWSQTKRVDIVTAIVLLQQSLDLHQLVSNQLDANNTEIILHGDRFSAQYYVLLSKYSENKLVHTLALATKTINQLLIQLTERKAIDFDAAYKLNVKIDTTLIVHLLRYLNLHQLEMLLAEEEPLTDEIEPKLIKLANLISECFKCHFQSRMIV